MSDPFVSIRQSEYEALRKAEQERDDALAKGRELLETLKRLTEPYAIEAIISECIIAEEQRDTSLARVNELESEYQRRVQDVADITRWKDGYKAENIALCSLIREYMDADDSMYGYPCCSTCQRARALLGESEKSK